LEAWRTSKLKRFDVREKFRKLRIEKVERRKLRPCFTVSMIRSQNLASMEAGRSILNTFPKRYLRV